VKKKKNKYIYKKLEVKVNGEVCSPDEYEIIDDTITFKIAPEPNAKIELVLEDKK